MRNSDVGILGKKEKGTRAEVDTIFLKDAEKKTKAGLSGWLNGAGKGEWGIKACLLGYKCKWIGKWFAHWPREKDIKMSKFKSKEMWKMVGLFWDMLSLIGPVKIQMKKSSNYAYVVSNLLGEKFRLK